MEYIPSSVSPSVIDTNLHDTDLSSLLTFPETNADTRKQERKKSCGVSERTSVTWLQRYNI